MKVNTIFASNQFTVKHEETSKEQGKIHVDIEGLGSVTINRTHEGVIIDVFDNQNDTVNVVSSICLGEDDFIENFSERLTGSIELFTPMLEVDDGFIREAYAKKNSSVFGSMQDYYNLLVGEIPLPKLVLLNIPPPKQSYLDTMLKYLYIPTTEAQNDMLRLIGTDAAFDFFMTPNNEVLVFGLANEKHCLVPIYKEYADEIIVSQPRHFHILNNIRSVLAIYEDGLSELGFFPYQNNCDYKDYQLEYFYGEDEKRGYSLNVHLTFNYIDRTYYIVLGTNYGVGFNGLHQITPCKDTPLGELTASFIDELRKSSTKDSFLAIIDEEPETYNDIIKSITSLSEFLHTSKI